MWGEGDSCSVGSFRKKAPLEIFTFGSCILLRIYPTGSLWRRQSQQSFNMLTPPFLFSFSFSTCFRWDIQLDPSKDYFYHNGSVASTQLDVQMLYAVCLYRYFDPWSPIHVIKFSTNIKIVKSLKFSVKTVLIYKKCKNVKISRWMGVCISLWWSGRSSKLFGLLVDQRRVDRAVGSLGFFLNRVAVPPLTCKRKGTQFPKRRVLLLFRISDGTQSINLGILPGMLTIFVRTKNSKLYVGPDAQLDVGWGETSRSIWTIRPPSDRLRRKC
jgi:hypothetical protein